MFEYNEVVAQIFVALQKTSTMRWTKALRPQSECTSAFEKSERKERRLKPEKYMTRVMINTTKWAENVVAREKNKVPSNSVKARLSGHVG